jgi:murein DD-endopeptidase MepM/ murein hydrolase activator NlpD
MKWITPDRLWWVGLLGVVPGAPGWMRPLVLLCFAPLAASAVRFVRRAREAPEDLPVPGPAQRSPVRFLVRHLVSTQLPLLNPRQRRETWAQLRGEREARARLRGAEPQPDAWAGRVRYTLPFRGEWLVVNGGPDRATSHSWEILSQRFAWDFVMADAEGRLHRGNGTRVEDYLCYGQPVCAPADGEVVAVVDGVRDAPGPGTGWVDWRAAGIGGNSVTLRHAEGEYSYLAHLVPGSISVRPGERVRRGDEVGRCGNSGHSTEPHLHFQVQDHPDAFRAAGLPVRFADVCADGEGPRELHPRRGMRVRAC